MYLRTCLTSADEWINYSSLWAVEPPPKDGLAPDWDPFACRKSWGSSGAAPPPCRISGACTPTCSSMRSVKTRVGALCSRRCLRSSFGARKVSMALCKSARLSDSFTGPRRVTAFDIANNDVITTGYDELSLTFYITSCFRWHLLRQKP